MCGIMGYVGPRSAPDVLLDGLRRLEYRGYDSAGVALEDDGSIYLRRKAGALRVLEELLRETPPPASHTGIGHTRWATHGGVSDRNAHPHTDCDGLIAIVHNGIIENADELRAELLAAGHTLRSDTDSELVAHMLEGDGDLRDRLGHVARRCEGAYALLVMDARDPGRLVAVRRTSPIAIGATAEEAFVGSAALALAPWLSECIYLDDGEIADVRPGKIEVFRLLDLEPIAKVLHPIESDGEMPDTGEHGTFFRKELMEQPIAWRNVMAGRLDDLGTVDLSGDGIEPEFLRDVERVVFLAMGTALHACQMAVERLGEALQIPAQAELASEFRDTRSFLEPGTLAVAVSVSIVSPDWLTALRHARAMGAKVLSLVNVPGSTIARESDMVLDLRAGIEISVASTKAFTTMVIALELLTAALGQAKGCPLPAADLQTLRAVPIVAEDFLSALSLPQAFIDACAAAPGVIYLGRGQDLSLAREGSLKLKELSYVWSEAFAAGELKHGPLALVDGRVPVIVCATDQRHAVKLRSSLAEATARGAFGVAVGSDLGATLQIPLPLKERVGAYLLAALPLQLLAVEVAEARGCPIDQPRNLAKSVTVE